MINASNDERYVVAPGGHSEKYIKPEIRIVKIKGGGGMNLKIKINNHFIGMLEKIMMVLSEFLVMF